MMNIPETDKTLMERIRIVRRDIGNLLFHFTKTNEEEGKDALTILRKILNEGKLLGSSRWIEDKSKCICFTEAPIQEFASLFSLVKIAADKKQRPRYEPYGVAVGKEWLYEKGGRAVIYDNSALYEKLPEGLKYRYVPFDPQNGVDCTWEREWRIRSEELLLEPEHTLIIVPDAKTAFEIAYSYSQDEVQSETVFVKEGAMQGTTWTDREGGLQKKTQNEEGGQSQVKLLIRKPKWMTVSLDLFDIKSE